VDHAEALGLLRTGTQRERLAAARALSRIAEANDLAALKSALRAEKVPWIRSALESGIARAAGAPSERVEEFDGAPLTSDDELAAEVYARATEELTDRFVHEVRPLLGLARLYASQEIPDYERSKTSAALTQLQDLLTAIDTLGRVSASPRFAEVDLSTLLTEIASACADEIAGAGFPVREPLLDGPSPTYVRTDRDLLCVAFRNGLRNAIEASISCVEPVVISWGQSKSEYWISILDFGDGVPVDIPGVFEIGSTSKDNHLGMGLAIAQRAVATLGGSVVLDSVADGATRFDLKVPREEA